VGWGGDFFGCPPFCLAGEGRRIAKRSEKSVTQGERFGGVGASEAVETAERKVNVDRQAKLKYGRGRGREGKGKRAISRDTDFRKGKGEVGRAGEGV